jgi:predicted RNA binding protein YcfA (HicA-like mRNA interferase family)
VRKLIRDLRHLGYEKTRQVVSHISLTCLNPREHHITIPQRDPIRVGTLRKVLGEVAKHHGLQIEELLRRLIC